MIDNSPLFNPIPYLSHINNLNIIPIKFQKFMHQKVFIIPFRKYFKLYIHISIPFKFNLIQIRITLNISTKSDLTFQFLVKILQLFILIIPYLKSYISLQFFRIRRIQNRSKHSLMLQNTLKKTNNVNLNI